MHAFRTLLVAASLVFIACEDKVQECPADATSCPADCREVEGLQWDSDELCWQYHQPATVGCRPADDLVEAVGPCVVRDSDDAAFLINGMPPIDSELYLCAENDSSDKCAACNDDNRDLICLEPESP